MWPFSVAKQTRKKFKKKTNITIHEKFKKKCVTCTFCFGFFGFRFRLFCHSVVGPPSLAQQVRPQRARKNETNKIWWNSARLLING
jgi:hypothetical protein